jgi:hypothetical protein
MVKVGILIHNPKKVASLNKISEALQKGVEKQGYSVDIITTDELGVKRLTGYGYLLVGTTAQGILGGKVDPRLKNLLEQAGVLSGKRASAFLVKPGIRSNKTLRNLMAIMEAQGLYLKNSAVFSIPEDADYFGKRLHIESPKQ